MTDPKSLPRWLPWMVVLLLVIGTFALRWSSFGFRVWNVDEAIHATVARTLLEGGTLYRDTVDQRTPLTYYAVAALFRVSGENNVWAMHALAAALIALTAVALFQLGRAWWSVLSGAWASLLFVVFSTALFYAGDAFALNTEWFVAAFTTLAAWAFWRGATVGAGVLLAFAFLSKQPALLDLGAPLAVLVYSTGRTRATWSKMAALLLGFTIPILIVAGYFATRGALADFYFYAWKYNLQYYGPEISTADRFASALKPFQLLATHYPLVLLAGLGVFGYSLFRVLQQRPEIHERDENPKLVYLLMWSMTSLAGAASGGRGYDHYFIQFLPPLCLASAWGLQGLLNWAQAQRARRIWVPSALLALAAALGQVVYGVVSFRANAHQPVDPSLRVSEYIKTHSHADDRIFVWGYHPDIYLFSERKSASRFVYASFLSGLIPWTNTAPDRDTAYAIAPGTRETLLRELTAARPAFIVDCSAGPNRFWQKYPLETFPALRDFVRANYRLVEAGQFVAQGFRLFQLRAAGESAATAETELPSATTASLAIQLLGARVPPVHAIAPHGASFNFVEGRAEYFAHAPSRLTYALPANATALRGGFGIREAAYAASNTSPTDGAEFVLRWHAPGSPDRVLFRRLLQPVKEAADRGVQSFRIEFPPQAGAELQLSIEPGLADNPTSDWTFWSDLLLETAP